MRVLVAQLEGWPLGDEEDGERIVSSLFRVGWDCDRNLEEDTKTS